MNDLNGAQKYGSSSLAVIITYQKAVLIKHSEPVNCQTEDGE
jgi:hypothetical protein